MLGLVEHSKSNDKKINLFFKKQHDNLLKEKGRIRDGGKLYESLFNLLTNNPLIISYAKKMNNDQLLDFIAQYISVPIPPEINQEKFDDLVKAGIKADKREALWRLAFNYNRKKINFSLIEDYFIKKRDSYYLIELISAVQEDLDIDEIIQKVMSTKDKKFINDFFKRAEDLELINIADIKEKMVKESEKF